MIFWIAFPAWNLVFLFIMRLSIIGSGAWSLFVLEQFQHISLQNGLMVTYPTSHRYGDSAYDWRSFWSCLRVLWMHEFWSSSLKLLWAFSELGATQHTDMLINSNITSSGTIYGLISHSKSSKDWMKRIIFLGNDKSCMRQCDDIHFKP